jgi:hypothetical protein
LTEQAMEIVALARKGTGDFGLEKADVVVEGQLHAGKGNQRSNLRGKRKVFPRKAQLSEEPWAMPAQAPQREPSQLAAKAVVRTRRKGSNNSRPRRSKTRLASRPIRKHAGPASKDAAIR